MTRASLLYVDNQLWRPKVAIVAYLYKEWFVAILSCKPLYTILYIYLTGTNIFYLAAIDVIHLAVIII